MKYRVIVIFFLTLFLVLFSTQSKIIHPIIAMFRILKTPDITKTFNYKKMAIELANVSLTINKNKTVVVGDSHAYFLKSELFLNCCAVEIVNLGIPGETSASLVTRLTLNPIPKVEHIYIIIGSNDVGRNVPAANTLQNIFSLVELNKNNEITFISIPISNGITRDNEKINFLNREIEILSVNNEFGFLDLNKKLEENGNLNFDYSEDGLHLNQTGNLIVTKIVSADSKINSKKTKI
jgi:hypothetical protein